MPKIDEEIVIPTDEDEHEHTPGYPAHRHDGEVIDYKEPSVDTGLYDQDRHDQDVADQAERGRLASLLSAGDLGKIAMATIGERGGEVEEITDPAPPVLPGGASFRVTHPRLAGTMRMDIYPEA